MKNSEKIKYFKIALTYLTDVKDYIGICEAIYHTAFKRNRWKPMIQYLYKNEPIKIYSPTYFYPLNASGKAKRIKLLKKIIKDLEKSL